MSVLSQIAEEEQKLEMTPMIDVTFLLLIFFMCTIKFKTLEGKLSAYLPKDVGVNTTQAEPKEKVDIEIHVVAAGSRVHPKGHANAGKPWDGKGRFVYDSSRRLEYHIGNKRYTDIDEVRQRLTKLHKDDPERGSTIAPKKNTVYQDVVPVLDAAIQADFTDITFMGAAKDLFEDE